MNIQSIKTSHAGFTLTSTAILDNGKTIFYTINWSDYESDKQRAEKSLYRTVELMNQWKTDSEIQSIQKQEYDEWYENYWKTEWYNKFLQREW